MNIAFRFLCSKSVKHLLVTERAKCRDCKNLCLTACEQSGAVCPRQDSYFTAYRTYLIKGTSVRTNLFMRNHVTHNIFFNIVEHLSDFLRIVRIFNKEMLHCVSINNSNIFVALELIRIADSLIKTFCSILTDSLFKCLRNLKELHFALFFSAGSHNITLELNNTLNLFMSEKDCLKNNILRKFICTCLNHHDSIMGACNGEVQIRNLALLNRRIDNKLTVNTAYANTCNRSVERNIRNTECAGSTNHSRDFRRIVLLNGHNRSDNLYVVAEALIEKRTNRAVNQTRAKNGGITRTAFSFDEASRNFSYRVHFFLIVNRQREKVHALTRLLRSRCRNQYDRIPIAYEHGTVRLFRHFSVFNDEGTSAHFHFKTLHLLSSSYAISFYV